MRLPRRLRARHGAPPRVQAFRGHCMCMLWYEGSGRAVRPRRGHKFFGFCCRQVGRCSVRSQACSPPRCSTRRAAPRRPQPRIDIISAPRGANTPRGARGAPACLGWARRTPAGRRRARQRTTATRRAPCMCAPRQARRQGQEGHAPEGSRRPDRRAAAGTLRGRCATK